MRTGALALLLLAGCGHSCDAPAPTVVAKSALEVEVSGCAELRSGPVCEVALPGELTLWVAGDAPLAAQGATLSAGQAVAGGHRHRAEIAAGVDTLTLEAGAGALTLRLEAPMSHPLIDAAKTTRRSEPEATQQKLEAALSTLEGAPRAAALGLLGRIALGRGDASGAVAHLRAALEADRAQGLYSSEGRDTFALVYTLVFRLRRFGEAQALIEEAERVAAKDPESRVRLPHYAAMLASETGDLRGALRRLDTAERGAQRLGMDAVRRGVRQHRAGVLQSLGRAREGEAALIRVLEELPEGSAACERASALHNLAWIALMERKAPAEAEPRLEQARALFASDCPRKDELANVLTTLSLIALQAKEPARASRYLKSAMNALPAADPRLRFWWLDIESRIALGESRHEAALQGYARLGALGRSAASPQAQWRAAVGRADALAALKRDSEAATAFAQAEALLDAEGLLVPLGEGRGAFLAERERGTRRYLDFLIDRGEAALALAVARRARSRNLAYLWRADQVEALPKDARRRWSEAVGRYRQAREALDAEARDDWTLPADALEKLRAERAARAREVTAALEASLAQVPGTRPRATAGSPPAPGELILAWHPTTQGLAAFAADAQGTQVRRLAQLPVGLPPATLSERLLAPFAAEIRRAKRLRLLPHAELDALDLHALPFDDARLIDHVAVAWSLDMPRPATPPAAAGAQMLIVADGRGDLRDARLEAQQLHAQAASRQQVSPKLLLGDSATGEAVRGAIAAADRLHYAGHGEQAGRDGWGSALPLAGGARLTVGDILALPRAPAQVMLSACESASVSSEGGLGVAQAFIAAGSRGVIATSRPIASGAAAALAQAFYASGEADPVRALRAAQQALRARDPKADWSAFRALVP